MKNENSSKRPKTRKPNLSSTRSGTPATNSKNGQHQGGPGQPPTAQELEQLRFQEGLQKFRDGLDRVRKRQLLLSGK